MPLYQSEVLDWSETMTKDVKTKIRDGLKAGASYEDIEKSLHEHTMNAVKMSCYIMTNMASISDVSLPFMLGMDTKSLVNVYQDAKTVDIGEDFLANMNAVSGIVGYGIKNAFRAAGDDRGYGYLLSGAIANARQKHLTPENTVMYVQKCGVANIIYNSAWAGMNGEPIQTMKGLGYSRVVRSSYVYPYDISDELASNIVNRFCKNKEAAQVFKNINDGTQDPFGGPQENQVRKELNVPADDKDDDMEKSV
jgi:hypothetical protein